MRNGFLPSISWLLVVSGCGESAPPGSSGDPVVTDAASGSRKEGTTSGPGAGSCKGHCDEPAGTTTACSCATTCYIDATCCADYAEWCYSGFYVPAHWSWGDCRAFASGDPATCTTDDCRGILTKDVVACEFDDCKAFVAGDWTRCGSLDCEAILKGDKGLCETQDCKAIVTGDRTLCESVQCEALIREDPSLCP
jgi:hypothetical protein